MIRRNVLPDLTAALEWLRDTWEARDTPDRLHTREHEGWGLAYAPAFARHLEAQPHDVAPQTTSRTCNHFRIPKNGNEWDCPDCAGRGTYETTVLAYKHPMWRAMTQLRMANRIAHDVVLTLVINAYDVPGTCVVLGCSPDGVLRAVRALHSRYEAAPKERTSWVDRSESQRNAETVAA